MFKKILLVVLVLGLAGSASAADALIAHWNLDETSGTIAADSVGSSDGTLQSISGGPTWTSSGQINGALSFDNDGLVNGTRDTSGTWDDNGNSFTLDFYIKTTYNASRQQQVWVQNDRKIDTYGERVAVRHWTNQWTHETTGAYGVTMAVSNDSGGWHMLHVWDTNFVTGNWVHVQAVRDATLNELRLYADGALQGTTSWTDSTLNVSDIMRDGLAMGIDTGDGNYTTSARRLDGDLDEVKLYNYTVPEPATIMLLGLGGLALIRKRR